MFQAFNHMSVTTRLVVCWEAERKVLVSCSPKGVLAKCPRRLGLSITGIPPLVCEGSWTTCVHLRVEASSEHSVGWEQQFCFGILPSCGNQAPRQSGWSTYTAPILCCFLFYFSSPIFFFSHLSPYQINNLSPISFLLLISLSVHLCLNLLFLIVLFRLFQPCMLIWLSRFPRPMQDSSP